MRHRVKGTSTFGRRRAHRKAMLHNMVASLIQHERIKTTHIRAKEVSKIAERLITYGKKDTLHARRLAYRVLENHQLVKKLFDEIAPRYKNRNGGYTRVIKLGYRRGDAAPVSILEYVEAELVSKNKNKKTVKKAEKPQVQDVPEVAEQTENVAVSSAEKNGKSE